MVKLTFSFSNYAGDIPTYEFTEKQVLADDFVFIDEQLDLCDDKVFVLFRTIKEDNESYHLDFFVTDDTFEANDFFFDYAIKAMHKPCNEHRQTKDFNFNFFCFETYEEAFNYCKDLKEGM
jgi:hypothetical protein